MKKVPVITIEDVVKAATDKGQQNHDDMLADDVKYLVLECGMPMNQLIGLVASGLDLDALATRVAESTDENETIADIVKAMTGAEMQHDSDAPPSHPSEAEAALKLELERMKAENNRLKAQKNTTLSLKVSAKGALSVYGLGRFPVTLYREQWDRLIKIVKNGTVDDFIVTKSADLKLKGEG